MPPPKKEELNEEFKKKNGQKTKIWNKRWLNWRKKLKKWRLNYKEHTGVYVTKTLGRSIEERQENNQENKNEVRERSTEDQRSRWNGNSAKISHTKGVCKEEK